MEDYLIGGTLGFLKGTEYEEVIRSAGSIDEAERIGKELGLYNITVKRIEEIGSQNNSSLEEHPDEESHKALEEIAGSEVHTPPELKRK